VNCLQKRSLSISRAELKELLPTMDDLGLGENDQGEYR
jgi:hypothetical protein